MTRRYLIAVTLILAAMLAWAPASVSAGHGLVVASEHSTASEFQNASTLDGVLVKGSGEDAYVSYVGPRTSFVDGFEDQDMAEYTAYDAESGSGISTDNVLSGSYSLETRASHHEDTTPGPIIHNATRYYTDSGLSEYPDDANGSEYSVSLYQDSNAAEPIVYLGVDEANSDSTGYAIRLNTAGQAILYRIDGSESTTTLDISNTPVSAGDGWTDVTLNFTGTGFSVEYKGSTQLSTTDTTYLSTDMGVGLGSHSQSGTASVWWDDQTVTEGPTSGTYLSQAHAASNTDTAWTNLTLTNMSAEITVTADTDDDGVFETTANSTTVSSTGNHTIDVSGTSSDAWRVNVTYTKTGTNAAGRLHDEGLLFNARTPTASNLSPSDGTKLTSSSTTISVDVNDTDFATEQGDTVTATLQTQAPTESSFTDAGQTTTSANGTVTVTDTLPEGGDWKYRWVLTDSYGETTTTSTQTVSVPDTLHIYNETDPDQHLNNSITVEVTFFRENSDEIITRTTTNGKVNLTGLPVGETFIVRATANNYHDRTILIESLFDTQSIYLLNTSMTTVENQFELDDRSGQFGDDTILIIKRPLTINGSTSYERLVAAEFGVEGHTTTLQSDVRYRILVKNDDRQRIVGSYIPTASGIITLEVGSIVYPKPDANGVGYNATEIEESGTQKIRVLYNDTDDATDSVTVTIYERGNESNVLTTYTATDTQQFVLSEPVGDNQTSYVVHIQANRGTSTDIDARIPLGGDYGVVLPMDQQWLGTIAMVSLVFLFALYQSRIATTGSIIVVLAAGSMMLFQVITIHPMSWWAAAAIAVGGHIRATAGGGAGV